MLDQQTKLTKLLGTATLADAEWDKLLKFWERTDKIVLRMLAQAQGDPKAQFQLDGKTVKSLETEWETLKDEKHSCKKTKCEKEIAKLMEITGKNISKIIPAGRKSKP